MQNLEKKYIDFRMSLPESASTIIYQLEKNGYDTYAVGGCCRDAVLGKTPHDYDICTSALPAQMKNVMENEGYSTYDTGIQHGTISVLMANKLYEVTTFRVDGEYTDGRHPDEVKFVDDVVQDLSRRDFTINAMAYKPRCGLVDPFGGMKDCENKLIRCVGDPNKRFQEDGLRIMRAIRFAATYGFEIEQETKKAIHDNKHLLRNVSAERKTSEFVKMLIKADAKLLMEYSDVLAEFIPEIKPMIGFNQKTPWHLYDVWEHTARAVEMAPQDPTVRLAVFFHDIGKPHVYQEELGRGHFREHGIKGKEIVEQVMRNMKFDTASMRDVSVLVEHHDDPISDNLNPGNIKTYLRYIGEENLRRLVDVQLADQQAQRGTKVELAKLNRDKATYEDLVIVDQLKILETINGHITKVIESGEPYRIKDLAVDGNDIMNLGISGRDIGDTLNHLLFDVIEHPEWNTKEMLLADAQHYIDFIEGKTKELNFDGQIPCNEEIER